MYHPIDSSHTLEVVLAEIFESNLCQEILLPSLDTAIDTYWHKTLLADNTAKATSLVTGRHMCERISQVVELAIRELLLWHVVLQPKHLGYLHFNAHLSSYVSEKIVVCGIDLVGLLFGSVIEPEDDISVVTVCVVELGPSD